MSKTFLLVPVLILALVACGAGTTPTTVATSTSATTVATSTSVTSESDIYTALPQSTTPDGYYVLGKPDAPIVMLHYSDFL